MSTPEEPESLRAKGERLFGRAVSEEPGGLVLDTALVSVPCTLPAQYLQYVASLAEEYQTEPGVILVSLITIGISAKVRGCDAKDAASILSKNASMNWRPRL